MNGNGRVRDRSTLSSCPNLASILYTNSYTRINLCRKRDGTGQEYKKFFQTLTHPIRFPYPPSANVLFSLLLFIRSQADFFSLFTTSSEAEFYSLLHPKGRSFSLRSIPKNRSFSLGSILYNRFFSLCSIPNSVSPKTNYRGRVFQW